MKLWSRPQRYIRHFYVQSVHWRRRLIFIVGGLTVGAAAVAMARLSDLVQHQFQNFIHNWHFVALIITPLGFALTAYLTRRFFANASGSGIPQAIAARALSEPAQRLKLVSIRIAIGKVALTLLGLLAGASTGREGPTVQIGASIMYALGRYTPRYQSGLILAGSAAGVAAAFNTPLAGIVFGIEEMARSFEIETSGLVIGTIIAAGLTSLAFLGNYTYFGTTPEVMLSWKDWIGVPICGVVGGISGGIFARILILFSRGFSGNIGSWIRKHPVYFAALCGLAVALCGIVSNDSTFGTGYDQANAALHGSTLISPIYAPLKFLATLLSSISGIPGGIFSPSLSVGAGLGAEISQFLPAIPVGVLVLLGMVSYFTGVTQAPITGFVIVSEMTDNHALLVPLMLAALIAQGVSRLLCREGVYHALAKNFLPPAP